MSTELPLMFYPAAICLVLGILHAYFGLHIVQRGVIFVDLALAQIAALGAVSASLVGEDIHSPTAYLLSVGATFLGATLLASSRRWTTEVAQEAFVGIVYVVAASAMIILLSFLPQATEELHALLVGHLLFVDGGDLLFVSLLYGGVGLLHFIWQKPLREISEGQTARVSHRAIWWWDVVFYSSFGIVVVSSVQLAGVLLVFALLILPAATSLMVCRGWRNRLLAAWFASALGCSLGISSSSYWDLPTGAAVVCGLALVFVLVLGLRKFTTQSCRTR